MRQNETLRMSLNVPLGVESTLGVQNCAKLCSLSFLIKNDKISWRENCEKLRESVKISEKNVGSGGYQLESKPKTRFIQPNHAALCLDSGKLCKIVKNNGSKWVKRMAQNGTLGALKPCL